MKPIKFDRDETKAIVAEIQDYFREELDQSVSTLMRTLLRQ